MSWAYTFRREPELSNENIRKAYELRGKVSEQERLTIETDYYRFATGELEKAISSVELFQQTFPRDLSRILRWEFCMESLEMLKSRQTRPVRPFA